MTGASKCRPTARPDSSIPSRRACVKVRGGRMFADLKRRKSRRLLRLVSTFDKMKRFPMNHLKHLIREVPDFPKPGIMFYDITTLLKDAVGLRSLIDELGAGYAGHRIDKVIGIEARGFIFAPAVAYALKAGFVPV